MERAGVPVPAEPDYRTAGRFEAILCIYVRVGCWVHRRGHHLPQRLRRWAAYLSPLFQDYKLNWTQRLSGLPHDANVPDGIVLVTKSTFEVRSHPALVYVPLSRTQVRLVRESQLNAVKTMFNARYTRRVQAQKKRH